MPRKYGQDSSCATYNMLANASHVYKTPVLANMSHKHDNKNYTLYTIYKPYTENKLIRITSINFNFNFYKTLCFDLDITFCPSEIQLLDYMQIQFFTFCTKLKSSSVLKFYIHFLITIFTIFDISSAPSTIIYKLRYRFQRNCILRHDYQVLLINLSFNYLRTIYPIKIHTTVIMSHIQVLSIIILPLNFIIQDIKQLINLLWYINKLSKNKSNLVKTRIIGGGVSNIFLPQDLSQYSDYIKDNCQYTFHKYISIDSESEDIQNRSDLLLISDLSLSVLVSHLSISNMKKIASAHNLKFNSKIKSDTLQRLLSEHICQNCNNYTTIFKCIDLNEKSEQNKKLKTEKVKQYQTLNSEKYKTSNLYAVKQYQKLNAQKMQVNNLEAVKQYQATPKGKESHLAAVKNYQVRTQSQFPPTLLSSSLQCQVISAFCKDTAPNAFQEAGCTVCGRLTLLTELQKQSDLNLDLDILHQPGITQKERYSSKDAFEDISSPILEDNLDSICNTCYKSLSEVFTLPHGFYLESGWSLPDSSET